MTHESFYKMNKIQALKTSGSIGLLGAAVAIGAMLVWPKSLDSRSPEVVRAQQKAEIIAYQIVQIYNEAQLQLENPPPSAQSRGLASVKGEPVAGGILTEFKNQGSMGMDPWGHPYQYRIIEMESGPRLLVWSLGPNGQLDDRDFLHDDPKVALTSPKLGDEIQVVLAISNHLSK